MQALLTALIPIIVDSICIVQLVRGKLHPSLVHVGKHKSGGTIHTLYFRKYKSM